MRPIVAGLFALSAAVAVLLVVGQRPFDASRFEFGQYRDYEGTLLTWPAPMLSAASGDYLLVGEGKHGIVVPSGAARQSVRLRGALAEHGPNRLLEILPGSLRVAGAASEPPATVDTGFQTLRGEIVDTKCYFGVMNPGRGKVHRDCAARCISGGIPPGLLVRGGTVYLLAGEGATRDLKQFAGETVSIPGRVKRIGSTLALEIAQGAVRRE